MILSVANHLCVSVVVSGFYKSTKNNKYLRNKYYKKEFVRPFSSTWPHQESNRNISALHLQRSSE